MTAAPNIKEALGKLVRDTYNEGFNEGMNEVTRRVNGGKSWFDVQEKYEAKLAAALTTLSQPTADRRGIVARIIDPDTYYAYDIHMRAGTIAENGKPWADVVCGKDIAAALAKADAILAALDGGRDA